MIDEKREREIFKQWVLAEFGIYDCITATYWIGWKARAELAEVIQDEIIKTINERNDHE